MSTSIARLLQATLLAACFASLAPVACGGMPPPNRAMEPDAGVQTGGATSSAKGGAALAGWLLKVPDGGFNLASLGVDVDALGRTPLGKLVCGNHVYLGADCVPAEGGLDTCVLPSFAGICTCTPMLGKGMWVCPSVSDAGSAPPCPAGAASGSKCSNPLGACLGGGAIACLCGAGTYTCL